MIKRHSIAERVESSSSDPFPVNLTSSADNRFSTKPRGKRSEGSDNGTDPPAGIEVIGPTDDPPGDLHANCKLKGNVGDDADNDRVHEPRPRIALTRCE